jgi:tRNA (mo5U34)-methyltransferase
LRHIAIAAIGGVKAQLPSAAAAGETMTELPSGRIEDFKTRFDELKGHFHSPFDFGHGMVTRPRHVQRRFRRRLDLLQDLTGKTVLDIGAWDGYFSFEFERRGAKRVLAIDSFTWDHRPEGYPRGLECFLLAREFYNSKVEHQRLDVHELSPELIGTFDLVFCAGVLYHMRHPLLGLEKIRSVTSGQLILETHQLILAFHEREPLIRFFPGDEEGFRLNSPAGFATRAWVADALTAAGFARHRIIYTPSFRWLKKAAALVTNKAQGGRLIAHAFVD